MKGKYSKFIINISLFMLFIILILVKIDRDENLGVNHKILKGRVIAITYDNSDSKITYDGNAYKYQEFKVEITSGKEKGRVFFARNTIETADVYKVILEQGDRILMYGTLNKSGKLSALKFYDRDRESGILILAMFLFLTMILIGRLKGVKSLISLIFTGLIIWKWLIPLILNGWDPVKSTLYIALVITVITLVILNGITSKSISAIIGTLLGTLTAVIFSRLAIVILRITGVADEETQKLVYFVGRDSELDFKGILIAGIILGAIGAVMDVSVSISAAMYEMIELKDDIETKELLKSGMNVGKDVLGSMSNTLILAYVGASFPLMLIIHKSNATVREMINLDMIACEVIRGVAGSIGICFTIPITCFVFLILSRKKR